MKSSAKSSGGMAQSRSSSQHQPARVVIVEDEGIVAMYLQSLMTQWGYDVVSTMSTGEDALEAVLVSPPDLMLMDIQLRGEMDGIDAALAINATHDLPIVFLTAFSDEKTLARVGSSEAYGFVRKPFDERDLRVAVEMALYRHRADRAVRQRSDWLGATLSSLSAGLIATDESGRIRFMNPTAERLTGWDQHRSFGRALSEVMPPAPEETGPTASDLVRSALVEDYDEPCSRVYSMERDDGTNITLELKAASIRSDEGGPNGAVVLFHDISEQRSREEKLVRLAHHDPLTGLPTRLLFDERLGYALDQSRRSGRPVGIIMLDLDRFKEINDSHGHSIGDRLLVAAAERIVASLRRSDTAARIGGDEIAVVLPELESAAGATRAAEKLVAAFDRPFDVDGLQLVTTLSAGVSVFPRDAEDSADLIERADGALYRAKQAGRNRAVVEGSLADDANEPSRILERDLRKAFDRGNLEVHYQPIYAVPSRRLTGAEALIRWDHADHGMISAADFLGTAIRSGLIAPITDRVLEAACLQAVRWHTRRPDLVIAVNLNDSQLLRRDLAGTVESVLGRSRLEPRMLQLEIAERSVIDRPSPMTAINIEHLRRLGTRVALDGFGSSHAAMMSLRRLHIDLLKIDRSLVNGLPDDPIVCAIVEATLAGACQLELETAAGGVEDSRQLEWLVERGCRFAQGFLLGPAVSAAEFERRFLGSDR